MTILALGINHKTASVELREKVAFNAEQLDTALAALCQLEGVAEAVIVSTCNRTELYCHGSMSADIVIGWLAGYHRMAPQQIQQHAYLHSDEDAIRHLMAVASGLDSLVLGEPQILGQVKQAYQMAKRQAAVGGVLERLFQRTFSVAKTVRTDTDVGQNAVSVAFAAVNLAKHIFAQLSQSRVLLVGAGDTAELVAQHLQEQGVEQIMVANRTLARAQELSQRIEAEPHSLAELPQLLPRADIVISSTASTLPIVGKGMVETALKQRRHKPILLVDLAVPRDIEEQVNELDDAYLYTVDDLQGIISENIRNREQAAQQALAIIAQHSQEFLAWLRSLNSVDMIRAYRQQGMALAQQQLQRAQQQLQTGKAADEVLAELANRLSNQLLHRPTQAIKNAGESGDMNALAAFRHLYDSEQ
ncbi:glutamyl-tRNA reductase [Idiomarina xiamenensis]|uniref:Glutamyl-tRNA reductase n=1 Tax=Idiomarina xiamenensis 10-D-4 TaxID=740709 RepID=K2K5D8_9GAMM|nr:glutamyl-tRNA reductase [Idiomarina xiamenensis]EKE82783.1 glutamyl-tRNA reductase [Idiomarina xiamenensis 10-D-4]